MDGKDLTRVNIIYSFIQQILIGYLPWARYSVRCWEYKSQLDCHLSAHKDKIQNTKRMILKCVECQEDNQQEIEVEGGNPGWSSPV